LLFLLPPPWLRSKTPVLTLQVTNVFHFFSCVFSHPPDLPETLQNGDLILLTSLRPPSPLSCGMNSSYSIFPDSSSGGGNFPPFLVSPFCGGWGPEPEFSPVVPSLLFRMLIRKCIELLHPLPTRRVVPLFSWSPLLRFPPKSLHIFSLDLVRKLGFLAPAPRPQRSGLVLSFTLFWIPHLRPPTI